MTVLTHCAPTHHCAVHTLPFRSQWTVSIAGPFETTMPPCLPISAHFQWIITFCFA